MSLTLVYIIGAVFGAIGGGIGKSHSTASGLSTFIFGIVIIALSIYTGIVYTWKNVVLLIVISFAVLIICSLVSGMFPGLKRKKKINKKSPHYWELWADDTTLISQSYCII